MLYMNVYEVSTGVKEITITYKEEEMNHMMLKEVMDYILDEYNRLQQDRAFEADIEA